MKLFFIAVQLLLFVALCKGNGEDTLAYVCQSANPNRYFHSWIRLSKPCPNLPSPLNNMVDIGFAKSSWSQDVTHFNAPGCDFSSSELGAMSPSTLRNDSGLSCDNTYAFTVQDDDNPSGVTDACSAVELLISSKVGWGCTGYMLPGGGNPTSSSSGASFTAIHAIDIMLRDGVKGCDLLVGGGKGGYAPSLLGSICWSFTCAYYNALTNGSMAALRPPAAPPTAYKCPATTYADGHTCDCGCGAWDPDCSDATLPTFDASGKDVSNTHVCQAPSSLLDRAEAVSARKQQAAEMNFLVSKDAGNGQNSKNPDNSPVFSRSYTPKFAWYDKTPKKVHAVPSKWKCPSEYFNQNDGCDCNCGAYDPDCDRGMTENHRNQTVLNCISSSAVCQKAHGGTQGICSIRRPSSENNASSFMMAFGLVPLFGLIFIYAVGCLITVLLHSRKKFGKKFRKYMRDESVIMISDITSMLWSWFTFAFRVMISAIIVLGMLLTSISRCTYTTSAADVFLALAFIQLAPVGIMFLKFACMYSWHNVDRFPVSHDTCASVFQSTLDRQVAKMTAAVDSDDENAEGDDDPPLTRAQKVRFASRVIQQLLLLYSLCFAVVGEAFWPIFWSIMMRLVVGMYLRFPNIFPTMETLEVFKNPLILGIGPVAIGTISATFGVPVSRMWFLWCCAAVQLGVFIGIVAYVARRGVLPVSLSGSGSGTDPSSPNILGTDSNTKIFGIRRKRWLAAVRYAYENEPIFLFQTLGTELAFLFGLFIWCCVHGKSIAALWSALALIAVGLFFLIRKFRKEIKAALPTAVVDVINNIEDMVDPEDEVFSPTGPLEIPLTAQSSTVKKHREANDEESEAVSLKEMSNGDDTTSHNNGHADTIREAPSLTSGYGALAKNGTTSHSSTTFNGLSSKASYIKGAPVVSRDVLTFRVCEEKLIDQKSSYCASLFVFALVLFLPLMVLSINQAPSNLDVVRGDAILPSKNAGRVGYASCGTRFPQVGNATGRFSLVDMAFIAKAAYGKDESNVQDAIEIILPVELGYAKAVVSRPTNTGSSRIFLTDFHFPAWNMTIIAVRGSTIRADWFENAYTWGEASMLRMIQSVMFFPIGKTAPWLIQALAKIRAYGAGYVSTAADHVDYVRKTRPHDQVMITGHSLGAGISNIVAAMKKIQGVGFEGPGVMLQRERFGFSREDADIYTFNTYMAGDPVPFVDKQAGDVQKLRTNCFFLTCHFQDTIVEDLRDTCGDPIRREFVKNDE